MIPTKQQIQELRSAFLLKMESDGAPNNDGFHPADLNRVQNSDEWLKRFLEHNDLDHKTSLQMLWETCEWRKRYGTNEINENNIRMEYIHTGSFFGHGRDVDGKAMLIFKSKKHVKNMRDLEDLKRCLVYWVDRLEREENGDFITIFFDMADTGLNNMDMEFTKYIIGLLRQYYPNILNYIVIYEMPWILNAAFKIIKSLLPAKAVAKMKFVNKNTLKDIVPSENALVCWGGKDDYEFEFESEIRQNNIYNNIPKPNNDNTAAGEDSASVTKALLQTPGVNKKVHFADGSPLGESSGNFGDRENGEMLTISPNDIIIFEKQGADMIGSVTLSNIDDILITYKIKTTSPEKFRVRPSTGLLIPGGLVTINVVLQPGYHVTGLNKDKFLVMCIAIPSGNTDPTNQDLSEMWKNPSGYNVEQHRLKCVLPGSSENMRNGTGLLHSTDVSDTKQSSNIQNMISNLTENNSRLQAQVKFTQTLQWISMGLTIILAIAIIYMLQAEVRNNSHQFCRDYSSRDDL